MQPRASSACQVNVVQDLAFSWWPLALLLPLLPLPPEPEQPVPTPTPAHAQTALYDPHGHFPKHPRR